MPHWNADFDSCCWMGAGFRAHQPVCLDCLLRHYCVFSLNWDHRKWSDMPRARLFSGRVNSKGFGTVWWGSSHEPWDINVVFSDLVCPFFQQAQVVFFVRSLIVCKSCAWPHLVFNFACFVIHWGVLSHSCLFLDMVCVGIHHFLRLLSFRLFRPFQCRDMKRSRMSLHVCTVKPAGS